MYKKIITTSNNKKILKHIAKEILLANFSPCIAISKKFTSLYKWNKKIKKNSEYSLTIKTSKNLAKKCNELIRKYHNYDTPEIIETSFIITDKKYKDWFNDNI